MNWKRYVLAVLAAALGAAMIPMSASATIAPTVSLSQSSTAAGSKADVGLDIKFAPTGSDSPKDLTVKLPAGLLANAAINGGACLTTTTLTSACQVGSGTATATPFVLGIGGPALSIPISFYLVPPPKAGDLAGVQVVANFLGTTNLGPPADVTVRPASDPAGVGLNESFTNLPNMFDGLQIAVDELKSTFTGLRLPASCPATPAAVAISGDSYGDTTTRSAPPAPLPVTACRALPFAPRFTVTAAEDSGDNGVKVVTDITQKANEATSRSVALAFPAAVLAPNAAAVINGGILCTDPSFATCKTVGSASSTSPLYPKSLIGKTYLTGSLAAPAITIRFPAPFALTLNGNVDLATNTTTFSGLPDIPLTDLTVTLAGGANAAFATTCNPANGTATSTLTTTNGDKTATVPAAFTISNCVAEPSNGGSGGGGGTGGSGAGGKSGGGGKTSGSRPTLTGGSISGLKRARPNVTFTAHAGRPAPKLRSLLIGLPAGLDFVRHRVHHRLRILGVRLGGARIRSLSVQNDLLFIRLRSPSARITVKIGRRALRESLRLALRARHRKVHSLTVGTIVRDASGHPTSLTLKIRRLHL
ncbi:MAG: hypothetical protein ACRDNK_10130 [Solirubrobacteraceae bacterium]